MSESPGTTSEGFVDLGAVQMYYQQSGDGPPLVLVHAGIADGRMWGPQLQRLGNRYRVIAPDLRGFGQTPMVEMAYSNPHDLITMCDALDIDRAAFIGASMGGTAVIDLALERPELVACIVDLGGVPSGYERIDPGTYAGWAACDDALERGDLDEAARIEFQMWVVGDHRDASAIDPELTALALDMLLTSYDNPDGDEMDPDQPAVERLGEVMQETLILVGELDRPDTITAGERMAQEMPRASLVSVPNAAHLLNLEYPDRVTTEIESFLEVAYPA